jgi:hypothetical protein
MAKLEGGCFCGAVRYRLTDTPIIVNVCHCLQCQNQTGSAFVVNAVIESAKLERQGAIEIVAMSAPGERPHDIHRCKKCKVALWSDYGRRKTVLFVRVGTLDSPARIKPDVHIYTRSKQPWVNLRGQKAFQEFYDPGKLWPARSLERWRAATQPT